ncbi:unnamed protein product [Macrosiphum euphorbiae]|uniref:Uncharacterized protein n=1 Tax=Macrosiphum euphorbiae TaxID=13131 RepID=A0AAV0XET1_9HEMI|nr:unnamed protein product [Macrosiphum euphorbiae]
MNPSTSSGLVAARSLAGAKVLKNFNAQNQSTMLTTLIQYSSTSFAFAVSLITGIVVVITTVTNGVDLGGLENPSGQESSCCHRVY